MRLLNGTELVGYIQERQARQVRALRQASRVFPKLAVVQTTDDPVISSYVAAKRRYGEEILIEVASHRVATTELIRTIEELNGDESVHGIIVQLPLEDLAMTDEAVNAVSPEKDVDGLGETPLFTPATAMAIDWLLAGYNVELRGKTIAIVGNGRLVGAPLARLWHGNGLEPSVYDESTEDLDGKLKQANIIVTATGQPGLITSQMLQPGAVVVDAGTASEGGMIVGDVAEDVRVRDDLSITPVKGGVGPLTVAALFDNVIQAARRVADAQDES